MPTTYRYTGQCWEVGPGLYFYRARWYDPALGRFIGPDTLIPQPENPQSLNRYSYALNGPVRYVDPSGHVTVEETAAYIQWRWGIEVIPDNWQVWELDWVIAGLVRLTGALGGEGVLRDVLGITFGHSVTFFRQSPDFYCTKSAKESDVKPRGLAARGQESDMLGLFPGYGGARVYFGDRAFEGSAEETARVVIHELAHVMDYQANGAYSRDMMVATGGYVGDYGNYHPGGDVATAYGSRSPGEDWAESLAAYLCPNAADVALWRKWTHPDLSVRFGFVRNVLQYPWDRL